MGNEIIIESKPWGSNTVVQKKDNRYGGEINVWSELNNHYAQKEINLKSDLQLQKMVEQINKRSQLIHPNFSTIKKYKNIDRSDFCASSHTLSLCFQYFENDLSKQIAKRSQTANYFRQQKICQIIYQICDCLAYLQQHSTYHGDIKPANIFFNHDDQVKLVDSYFTNMGRANFELVLSSPTCQSYLSPAQLEKLKKGSYEFNDNKYKNQIFSLGMTLMEAMLLKNSFECYEFTLLKIIDTKVLTKSAQLRQKYSTELVKLIQSMIEINQDVRPSAAVLLKNPLLKPFSGKRSVVGALTNIKKTGNLNPISPPSHNLSFSSK